MAGRGVRGGLRLPGMRVQEPSRGGGAGQQGE